MDAGLAALSSNKLFTGLAMLMMNLGSRYIIMDIGSSYEALFDNVVVKQLIVFCMFFASTRDVKLAGILTFAFWFVVMGLLNKKRPLNVLPSFLGVSPPGAEPPDVAKQYSAGVKELKFVQ